MTQSADPLRGRAIFVAPHLDDVVLSCGGTVARHAIAGQEPLIVTVAAGVPSRGDECERHSEYVERRRQEDAAAAAVLGASIRWFPYLDAVYRGYRTGVCGMRRDERNLAEHIALDLERVRRDTGAASVFLPLGIGNHVDHALCASLHDQLRQSGAMVWQYEDVPYVLRWTAAEDWINATELAPRRSEIRPHFERLSMMRRQAVVVDVTQHMNTRLAAVECYKSQLSGLFPRNDHRLLIRVYATRLMSRAGAYGERFWAFGN